MLLHSQCLKRQKTFLTLHGKCIYFLSLGEDMSTSPIFYDRCIHGSQEMSLL